MNRTLVEKAIQRIEIQKVHLTRLIAYLEDTIQELRLALAEPDHYPPKTEQSQ